VFDGVTFGDDVILGYGGDDSIFGLAGDDFLDGGEGADALHGRRNRIPSAISTRRSAT
jgi:Ca2+-binding RTX toxin-like protein